MILISEIWNYLLMCRQKSLSFTGSRLRDIKIQSNIHLHASFVGKGATTKEYTPWIYAFKWMLELQRIVLCYEIHLPCKTRQPIGTLWNTCFHKNIHIAYYQEWQIKTSNINLYKFCSISTKFQLKCFIYLYNTIWVVHQDSV